MDTAASAGYRFNQTADAYAIPIAAAMQVADDIEAGQASSTVHIGPTAMLGVEVQTASAYTATGSGAVIAGVLDNGPAKAAGLAAGDVIIGLGGQPVHSPNDVSRIIVGETPGTTVTVQYVDREGATRTAQVRLATGAAQ
jgi:S1-C subfamily serine protease